MSQRKCGFCKQIGHNRRSCPAFITSEYLCKIILKNDSGSIVRNVGWSSSCECYNCNNFDSLKVREWIKILHKKKPSSYIKTND